MTGTSLDRPGLGVADLERLDPPVTLDVDDGGVPEELDLRVRKRAVLHDLGGAQLLAPVDERHLVGEAGEEVGFLERGVAAADDGDVVAAEEEAVAGRARGNAVTEERLLVRQPEHAGLGAGRDDDRAGELVVAADPDPLRVRGEIDLVDVGGDELGAEALGLLAELRHEVGADDAVGEARVVLDVGRQHQLPAGLDTFDDERLQVGPGGVDGGRESRRARPDDDDVPRVHGSYVRSWPEVVDQGLRLLQQNPPAIRKIPPSVHQAAQV